jgi:hypothetical protein
MTLDIGTLEKTTCRYLSPSHARLCQQGSVQRSRLAQLLVLQQYARMQDCTALQHV